MSVESPGNLVGSAVGCTGRAISQARQCPPLASASWTNKSCTRGAACLEKNERAQMCMWKKMFLFGQQGKCLCLKGTQVRMLSMKQTGQKPDCGTGQQCDENQTVPPEFWYLTAWPGLPHSCARWAVHTGATAERLRRRCKQWTFVHDLNRFLGGGTRVCGSDK